MKEVNLIIRVAGTLQQLAFYLVQWAGNCQLLLQHCKQISQLIAHLLYIQLKAFKSRQEKGVKQQIANFFFFLQ